LPLTAALLLSWTAPAVHTLLNKILIAQKSVEDYFAQDSAYFNRQDYQGAIADYQKAADLYLEQGNIKGYQGAINKQKSLRQKCP
jgi:tetratricopeptide (TPR) repeat protein